MKGENISNDENEQILSLQKILPENVDYLGGPLFNFVLTLIIFFMINLLEFSYTINWRRHT